MSASLPYYCPACKLPNRSIRCSLCGGDCEPSEEAPAPTHRALSDVPVPPPRTITHAAPADRSLMLQTAVSQWLYGRMLDEDPCTSLLKIARTSARLWQWLTSGAPDTAPYSLWDQALLADARYLFGHHFQPAGILAPLGAVRIAREV